MQEIVILSGLPGSGKSTFAKQYSRHKVITQDGLGKKEFRKMYVALLKAGENIVIDRCNISREQRAEWIKLAKQYNPSVTIVSTHLVINARTCKKRLASRKGHPTISNELPYFQIKKIFDYHYSRMEIPDINEGFDSTVIYYWCNQHERYCEHNKKETALVT